MANKRSILTRILSLLSRDLSVNKNVAYANSFNTIVNGLLVEGTPYKDTVYIYRYVQPFFTVSDRTTLTYSRRLSRSRVSDFFEGSDQEIASACVDVLRTPGTGGEIGRDMAPGEFIDWVTAGNGVGRAAWTAFDLAASYTLLGNVEKATLYFQEARSELIRSVDQWGARASTERLSVDIDTYQRLLLNDLALATPTIEANAKSNASLLGFVSTLG